MRTTSLIAALLFVSTAAVAQQSSRPTFPDDYTPSPCAPATSCRSYIRSELPNAAFAQLGLQLDLKWIDKHYDEMTGYFAPICRKHATCLATPGNNFLFCDDILVREFREVCDRHFPKAKDAKEAEECRNFTEIWALGMDMNANFFAEPAQKCARENRLDRMHAKPPVVWMEPASLPRGYKGDIYIYAIDADTHVPVQADIKVGNQIIYAPANPAGSLSTGYPFKWPVKYVRVKNSEGHEDTVPPVVKVISPYYPEVSFPMPSKPGKMIVSMTPAKLRPGKNTITVTAKDAETGEPVEARVMANDQMIGDTNQVIEFEVPKGKLPEIWATSLFDMYSDVVVAK